MVYLKDDDGEVYKVEGNLEDFAQTELAERGEDAYAVDEFEVEMWVGSYYSRTLSFTVALEKDFI